MTGHSDVSPTVRSRATIVVWLVLALAALLLLLAALGGMTVWGMQRAGAEILRAEQSLKQLENARAIEAAYNLYLLGEIGRRITGGGDPAESAAAAALRDALLSYRRTIGEEIAAGESDAERADERAELVRADALADLFETVETEAMLDRVAGPDFDAATAVRRFQSRITAGRDEAFRAVTFEILQDERQESGRAFMQIVRLRDRLVLAWSVLAGAFVLAAAGFGLIFYRGLMRPIRELSAAAERFSAAPGPVRAPEDLPGEFAVLARQFNAMAGRIETEQHRLQAEVAARTADLEAANAELTQIDQSRRRFFANISHELRTPVTVLLGEAQIALRRPGDERGALERIAASGGFLGRRLDDLLRLASCEDGEIALSLGPTDLAATVADATEAARAYAAANEISLDFTPGPPQPMTGDGQALRQAALALIDNAIKFSSPGGTVCVSVFPCGFEVADRGPGFEGGEPDALFERYVQERAGRRAGGVGLGLAIVKWITEQHGGRITAAARRNGGAVFRVEFPE